MDKGEINLLDVLKRAVSDAVAEPYAKVCKVDSYNEDTRSVDVSPLDETAPILNVRIIAGESETPILIVPKVGSFVMVTFVNETSAFVSMFSEVETVAIRGDQYGGLIKVEELKKQLDIVTDRIDTLFQAIKDGVVAPNDGGAAYQTSMKAILAGQVEKEKFDEIENELVKHG